MKRNPNRPFWNLASLLGESLYLGLPPPPKLLVCRCSRRCVPAIWEERVVAPKVLLLCYLHLPCWSPEDHRLPPRLSQSVRPLPPPKPGEISGYLKRPEGRECCWPQSGQCGSRRMSKMTIKAPLCSHDLRAHTSSWHQMGTAWSGARERVLGVLLDLQFVGFFFFFLRNRNIKQAASSPSL